MSKWKLNKEKCVQWICFYWKRLKKIVKSLSKVKKYNKKNIVLEKWANDEAIDAKVRKRLI